MIIRKKRIRHEMLCKDNELKLWFYDCIKSIKKEMAGRRMTTIQMDLNEIGNIEQFKLHDKIKLM
jgi:hypothetical protein